MRRMLGARDGWAGILKRFRLLQQRPFSTNNRPTIPSNNSNNNGSDKVDGSLSTYDETYRQLDKLDFMTAAKILFTTPPKKKKFGFDFHLVQFFFACMPSLAVYLVAQYARHEMRRMEAELELKKKAEEAKAKETELNASEEKEAGSDPEILEVKVRLDKLEEAVKEIAVESKKQLDSTLNKKQEDGSEKRHHAATDNSNTLSRSETSNSAASNKSENVAPNSMSDASQQDLKGIENGVSAKK